MNKSQAGEQMRAREMPSVVRVLDRVGGDIGDVRVGGEAVEHEGGDARVHARAGSAREVVEEGGARGTPPVRETRPGTSPPPHLKM